MGDDVDSVVPVDTGALKASKRETVVTSPGRYEGSINYPLPYGIFTDRGTRYIEPQFWWTDTITQERWQSALQKALQVN